MLENTVLSWTSKISFHARKGLTDRALSCFLQMLRAGIDPNQTTFSTTLGASVYLQTPFFGKSLHCLILKKGFTRDLFVSTALLTLYSKHSRVAHARKLFDEMPERDVVSWNSMISGYAQNGFNMEACVLFRDMLVGSDDWSLCLSNFTLASILKACAGLGYGVLGKLLHGYAIKMCLVSDIFVASSIVDMYCKCDCLTMGRLVFDLIEIRDLVLWNTMITGCAQNDHEEEAIQLFYQLKKEGFAPNETTYACILKASTVMSDISYGRCFHAKSLKSGFLLDVYVGTPLVDMYTKFSEMGDAKKVFNEMKRKNLITFNALITGYGVTGGHEEAIEMYMFLQSEGLKPDSFTFMGLFSACTVKVALLEGVQVHCHSIRLGLESDVFVGNSVMKFYFKCGLVDHALKALESISAPGAITWAGTISGFVHNGDAGKAIDCFRVMYSVCEVTDEFSTSSVLKAITSQTSINLGQQFHAYILKLGFQHTAVVGSSLIDMYSKCGTADEAHKVFSELPENNVVCWNSMITGYAHNGLCLEALQLFQEMEESGVSPTSITFTGVLYACSRAGLVDEGRKFYKSMVHEFGIPPSIEHCTCMIDLLGRAGYLNEAEAFLLNSPYSKEPDIWEIIVAACEIHNNSDVSSRAAQHCLSLQSHDLSSYTSLSNICASNEP